MVNVVDACYRRTVVNRLSIIFIDYNTNNKNYNEFGTVKILVCLKISMTQNYGIQRTLSPKLFYYNGK